MNRRLLSVLLALAITALAWPAHGGENMIGNQSQNEGMFVVPAPGPVTIDGDLGDWDLSGRIHCFAEKSLADKYSAEVSAMWTAEAMYLVVKWRDTTPMLSLVDPAFNPDTGWRNDALQIRMHSPDRTSWLTMWYFTPQNQPVLHIANWKQRGNARGGQDAELLVAKPNTTQVGKGVEIAYKKDADGKGYVQEMKFPWAIFFATAPAIEPGLNVQLGFEFLWGGTDGKTGPIHRYADNLQAGETSREFFWSGHQKWGDARLVAKGNLTPRRYVTDGEAIFGTIPVRATIPAAANSFTLVVEDADGQRIRNLAGGRPVDEFSVATAGDERTVEVMWDGLNDDGALVAPGTYSVRGLSHDGLTASYDMSFYNPGTPAWPTADGTGAWGADHGAPLRVAAAGDHMIVSWQFAEGGSGIIAVDTATGRKVWGEKRGGRLIAADTDHLYAVPDSWHIKEDVLMRMDRRTGAYTPFVLDGVERPFELPAKVIAGTDEVVTITALAASGETVAVGLKDGRVLILDKDSATTTATIAIANPTALAFAGTDTLYVVSGNTVKRVAVASGAISDIPTPGAAAITAITTDADGRVIVADMGSDKQLKAYTTDGKLAYTIGLKGGRPIRGAYDKRGLREVTGVAVDAAGQVWTAEHWNYPRRVGVWSPTDGSIVKEYIGNTGYAGTGCFLHDEDPTLAYVGPIELKLDRATKSWNVTQILWVPDREKGETFEIDPGAHVLPQRFSATVNGVTHDYLFEAGYRDYEGYVVYMAFPTGWRPVSAIVSVSQISGRIDNRGQVTEPPTGEFADLHPYDVAFWNDANADGKVQRSECEIVKTDQPGDGRKRPQLAIRLGSGWGQRMTTDFVFYMNGIQRVAPVRFAESGAPIYTTASVTPLGFEDNGDFAPVPEEDLLISLSWKGYAGPTGLRGIDTRDGSLRWQYPNPYPGVHGSHRATMPKPGLLIGPLKTTGVLKVNDHVGHVFGMRGNLGQDFYMTSDGLFIGTMFQDTRLPDDGLPNTEAELEGMAMHELSNGGEPFNGWLGRQSDGVVRLTTGMPRQAAMILEIDGFDSIQRFTAPALTVDAAALAAADSANRARAAAAAGSGEYTITRMAKAPTLDGALGDWTDIPALTVKRDGFPASAEFRLSWDAENLYLAASVSDTSPWLNEGKDYSRLFKTGDAVDLQIGVDPKANADRRDPAAGDLRLLISQLDGKPVVVLMRPVDATAPAAAKRVYTSPVAPKTFARVEVLAAAQVAVVRTASGYTVEAAIPVAAIGLTPAAGLNLRGDLGFITSDTAGRINTARIYWSNDETGLVNDEPQEAWFSPAAWGDLILK